VQSLETPPLMLTQEEFLDEIRKINPLVCLEHCRHLGLQLQVCSPQIESFAKCVLFHHKYVVFRVFVFKNLGECILLPGNLIVLSPEWFWQDVLNWQLSPDQRGRLGGRTTGVYTLEDFQARCPCPAAQALQALQAVNLCVPVCSVKSEILLFQLRS